MKHIKILTVAALAAATVSAMMTGCRGGGAAVADSDTDTATYLHMTDRGAYLEAVVLNPWHEGDTLGHYGLWEGDKQPAMPAGITPVHTPLKRSIVYSSVHTAAIYELGAESSICGVADGQYFSADDPITARLASGNITDIGSSMAPTIEKVVDLHPDAILLSPMDGAGTGRVESLGIPLIFMADYMEPTPLGRASWITLIGALYGRSDDADAILAAVKNDYKLLKQDAAKAKHHPTVFTERPFSGVWYVPGGASYMARMIADAGGRYAWSDDTSTGSLPLSEEAVIGKASDADIWLIRELSTPTAAEIEANVPHARAFKAFPGGVYVCNTMETPIFNDIAFHPERILADFVKIFNREPGDTVSAGAGLRYYKPLK